LTSKSQQFNHKISSQSLPNSIEAIPSIGNHRNPPELLPGVVPVRKTESFPKKLQPQIQFEVQEDFESIPDNQSISTWNSPHSLMHSDTPGGTTTTVTKKIGQNRPKTTYYYNESSNSTILSGSSNSNMSLPRSLSPIRNDRNALESLGGSWEGEGGHPIGCVLSPKATLHRPFDTDTKSVTSSVNSKDIAKLEMLRELMSTTKLKKSSNKKTIEVTSSSNNAVFNAENATFQSMDEMKRVYSHSSIASSSSSSGDRRDRNDRSDRRVEELPSQSSLESVQRTVTFPQYLIENVDGNASISSTNEDLPLPMGRKQRTLYVGKGLGFKHNHMLDSQLQHVMNKGSAKGMLKKILGDEE